MQTHLLIKAIKDGQFSLSAMQKLLTENRGEAVNDALKEKINQLTKKENE